MNISLFFKQMELLHSAFCLEKKDLYDDYISTSSYRRRAGWIIYAYIFSKRFRWKLPILRTCIGYMTLHVDGYSKKSDLPERTGAPL